MSITAKLGKDKDGPTATVEFDLPDSIKAAVELWDEEVCLSRINAAVTIDVQAVIRRGLENDPPKSSVQIQEMVDEFTPGIKKQGKSKADKAEEAFGQLSDDEREELFKKFGGGNKKSRR